LAEPRFIQIPPEETLLQFLRQGLKEAGISQRKLAEFLETDQASISRKLAGKRPFRLEEISAITSLILERVSSIPQEPISRLYVPSQNVVRVYSDDIVSEAARKMTDGDFTQLLVIDMETKKSLGLVTDFTLLKRMLSPTIPSKENWLQEFRNMEIKDADVIDEAPTYPLNTPIAEIAQALLFHYAVLISEGKGKIGIVTRADFLKLLT
jgi:predicted transcriptional regulator